MYKDNGKLAFSTIDKNQFINIAESQLEEIQKQLFLEAKERRDSLIIDDILSLEEVQNYFGEEKEDNLSETKGWVRVGWSKPTGPDLQKIVNTLKKQGLTIRNAPLEQTNLHKKCIFTGMEAQEEIIVARTY